MKAFNHNIILDDILHYSKKANIKSGPVRGNIFHSALNYHPLKCLPLKYTRVPEKYLRFQILLIRKLHFICGSEQCGLIMKTQFFSYLSIHGDRDAPSKGTNGTDSIRFVF
jgi:hypothetical protein